MEAFASKLTIALTAFVCGSAWLPAHASAAQPAPPGPASNHHHVGNGHHNRNILTVRSPTHNRGYQHTSNGNAGGLNNVQNALCRESTVCHVTQKVIIITPERPVPPQTGAAPPIDAPGMAQPQVRPEIKPEVRPEIKPEVRPMPQAVEAPTPSPFMYMGPHGFMLLASDSSTPLGFRSDDAGAFNLPAGLFP